MRALVKAKAEPGLWMEDVPEPEPGQPSADDVADAVVAVGVGFAVERAAAHALHERRIALTERFARAEHEGFFAAFGEADQAGIRRGFYTVSLDRPGANFFFLGIDLDDERLTLELLNGNGGGTSNPDRTTVERYVVSQASRGRA